MTVSASWSRGMSVVATEQMLPQQLVWRRSQLAARSAANLTGYISYTSSILKKQAMERPSMYFHFEMTWRCFGVETNIFARGFLLKPWYNFQTSALMQRVCLISTIKQTLNVLELLLSLKTDFTFSKWTKKAWMCQISLAAVCCHLSFSLATCLTV